MGCEYLADLKYFSVRTNRPGARCDFSGIYCLAWNTKRGVVIMSKPAARVTDKVLQMAPHCHAPIHPAAPVPTPVPHPAMPLPIIKGQPNVLIGGLPAARVMDTTSPCMLAGCVPGGPGMIAMGSATVIIGGMPAARVGDMTSHPSCVAPIPSPTGNIIPPGCPTVLIGG